MFKRVKNLVAKYSRNKLINLQGIWRQKIKNNLVTIQFSTVPEFGIGNFTSKLKI